MTNYNSDNKRIAKNTLLLYIRMIILILVQLYTVPIVLRNLGLSDYGLYNVIGGVVTMFSFLSGSLTSGTHRYIAYAIGKNDTTLLKNTFNITITIFIAFAIVSFIIVEIFGLWFVNYKMNIPNGRMNAANWILQFSIISFILSIIAIPYRAAIIAHEKMGIYAYVSIAECIAKLGIAISLSYVLFDKLIFYAFLILLVSFSLFSFHQSYCKIKFIECKKLNPTWDAKLGKSLLTYSGWNVIGYTAIIGRSQGSNIIMNLFFGTLLNAAHAISTQINGVITQFINNIYLATRPPITKLYAQNKKVEMWNLIFQSAKIAFYLLTIISVPAIAEIKTILILWLKKAPPYTEQIVIMMIATTLIETLINQLIAAFQAANKIKRYQVYSSTIILLNIPASYLLLKFGLQYALIPYIVSIFLSVLYAISIIWVANKEVGLDVMGFLKKVLIPNISVFILILGIVLFAKTLMAPSMSRIIYTFIISLITSFIIIWAIGLNTVEKQFIKQIVRNKILKN